VAGDEPDVVAQARQALALLVEDPRIADGMYRRQVADPARLDVTVGWHHPYS
jgi:hypothetical protein